MCEVVILIPLLCVLTAAGSELTTSVPEEITNCTKKAPCLRKCCRDGYAVIDFQCNKSDNEPILVFHGPNLTRLADIDVSKYTLVYGQPCEGSIVLQPEEYESDEHYLLTDGTLFMPSQPNPYINYTHFCFDYFIYDELGLNGTSYFVCFTEESEVKDTKKVIFILYPIFIIISAFFLVCTLLVYSLVPELRNLHGKTLMCKVSSLLCAYIFLVVVQLERAEDKSIVNETCKAFAFIIYFSFLSSFFWLNIMAFDIWWTFSGFRPMLGPESLRDRKKMFLYCLYAWGCPLLLLAVVVTMDEEPSVSDTFIKPGFAVESCWFKGTMALVLYFLCPVTVVILSNTLFFGLTLRELLKVRRSISMLKEGGSQKHSRKKGTSENDSQRLNLYAKLFVIMGLSWITEIISAFVGGSDYVWIITDIVNALQGVFIFVIFVCKRNIWKLLIQRYPKLGNITRCIANSSNVDKSSTKRFIFKSQSSTTSTTEPSDSIVLEPHGNVT